MDANTQKLVIDHLRSVLPAMIEIKAKIEAIHKRHHTFVDTLPDEAIEKHETTEMIALLIPCALELVSTPLLEEFECIASRLIEISDIQRNIDAGKYYPNDIRRLTELALGGKAKAHDPLEEKFDIDDILKRARDHGK